MFTNVKEGKNKRNINNNFCFFTDTSSTDATDMQLSVNAVKKLGFLIGATCDGR